MKIKYKLTYEWESSSTDIESYAKDNDCNIYEAINKLIQWNIEEYYERMEMRAANVLSGYTNKFEYEVVND